MSPTLARALTRASFLTKLQMRPPNRLANRGIAPMPQSMFLRYGGAEKVSELIFALYDRVLASKRLSPFFATCDMRRLIEHQTRYISSVMDGSAIYNEDHLREVHGPLGIGSDDFDEMLEHLRAAMDDRGYHAVDIDDLLRRISGLRRVVVTN